MAAQGSLKYSLSEPFEKAVESVFNALLSRGIRVAGQLEVSRRLQGALGIVLMPCKIMFVLPHAASLSADSIHPWAAVFLPLHIVISGYGSRSEVEVLNRVQGDQAGTPYGPVVETQRQVVEAIEAVALRASLLA